MAKSRPDHDPAGGMSEAKRAYEARRAEKAGMTLDKWLAQKEKAKRGQASASARRADAVRSGKKPGVLTRLLARARGES